MTDTVAQESQWRKAAVLVAGLDSAATDLLLEQLPDATARKIRQDVMEIESIDEQEQRAVWNQFQRACYNNSDTDDAAFSSDYELEPGDGSRSLESSFGFLEDALPASFGEVLSREHPQIIAVILAHLPPNTAAGVVERWPDSLQADVLSRVAHLDELQPDVLESLEKAVYAIFSSSLKPRRACAKGITTVASIVSHLGTSLKPSLLARVAHHDTELAEALRGQPSLSATTVTHSPTTPTAKIRVVIEFDDLERLTTASWAVLLQAVGADSMLLALAGARPGLVEALLRIATPKVARALQRRLAQIGPLTLEDIDRAQRFVAQTATELTEQGKMPVLAPRHFAAAV